MLDKLLTWRYNEFNNSKKGVFKKEGLEELIMTYEEFCSAYSELVWALGWAIKGEEKGSIRLAERDILNLVIDNPEHAERYLKESGEKIEE